MGSCFKKPESPVAPPPQAPTPPPSPSPSEKEGLFYRIYRRSVDPSEKARERMEEMQERRVREGIYYMDE